jgi:hypothetical protein
MNMNLASLAQMTVRGTGVLLLLLGIWIWTGRGDQAIPIHMLLGFLLVLGLWTLAFLAARARVATGLAALGFGWGLLAPLLGLTQENLVTGDLHWVIQVVHLLVGLGAIGIAERLGAGIRAAGTGGVRDPGR